MERKRSEEENMQSFLFVSLYNYIIFVNYASRKLPLFSYIFYIHIERYIIYIIYIETDI